MVDPAEVRRRSKTASGKREAERIQSNAENLLL